MNDRKGKRQKEGYVIVINKVTGLDKLLNKRINKFNKQKFTEGLACFSFIYSWIWNGALTCKQFRYMMDNIDWKRPS